MSYNYIVTPIVGAIIGYTTNWIAIKMLFRPYTEKRIMGIKVPFTPGLIPNERERIALAMGEVIEQYLLTDEVILKELTSDSIDKIILSFFEEESHIKEGQLNISLFFQNKEEVSQLSEFMNQLIWEKISETITQESFKSNMVSIIKEKLIDILKEKSIKELVINSNESVKEILTKLLDSNSIKKFIVEEINCVINTEASIKELLGVDWLEQIRELLKYNEPKIKKAISELVNSEQFAVQGKEMISLIISNKFGALGSMFVNPASIYESIVQTVEEKLESTNIVDFISEYMNQIFEHRISDYIEESSKINVALQISNKMLGAELIDKVQAYILNMEISLYEWVDNLFEGGFEGSIDTFAGAIYNYTYQYFETSQTQAKEWTRVAIEGMLNKPISLTKENKEKISQKVLALYHMIIRKYVIKLIASVKLSNIIEKQINSFEIEMFEEVILTIAKKELRAITWLGGLLGFVMSIVILLFK